MKEILIHSRQGEFKLNTLINEDIEIWIDYFSESNNINAKKIFVQMEIDEYFHLNKEIIQRQNEFDYIFAWEKEVLDNCRNGVLFEYGTAWIKENEYTFPEKKFSISFVCTDKFATVGHFIRRDIYQNQNNIKIPIDFYISSMNQKDIKTLDVDNKFNNKQLGASKIPLFDSMFSICIENTEKEYYFSEKLIDCLLCKSIPIYYGCKGIDKYFNTDGFIIFNDAVSALEQINNLNPEFYHKRIDIIEENYNKAKKWTDYSSRLTSKIEQTLTSEYHQ